MLRELLERSDRDGTRVRLNVLQGRPAQRIYERHGFKIETEEPVDVFMVREPALAVRDKGSASRFAEPHDQCGQDKSGAAR
ncbi:hypothetical protein SUDANB2_07163 [Streptomyces sp. enrichment culture]